jgi:hypothetical protein
MIPVTIFGFQFAGHVLNEHGWKWGVPSLALASIVGASRINDIIPTYIH